MPMPTSRLQTVRHSLQLSIDPSLYDPDQVFLSSDSNSPSSTLSASIEAAGTTLTSGGSEFAMYSVLCLWDFESNDPDHLPFRKNEILDIVKEEETGWWAAMRRGVFKVGWIPKAFVKPLTDEMAERLRNVREELRVFEYEAEQLYISAPTSNLAHLYGLVDERFPSPQPEEWERYRNGRNVPVLQVDVSVARDISRYVSTLTDTPSLPDNGTRMYPPPSPATPMPHPPISSAPIAINKPTPPTPTERFNDFMERQRSNSSPLGTYNRNLRRRPLIVDDQPSLARLSTLLESSTLRDADLITSSPHANGDGLAQRVRADKIKQLTGSEEALAFHNAVQAQANLPWYLRPSYADQLEVDKDGQIRRGTLLALVERLSSDIPGKEFLRGACEESTFRRIFLTTFRTFTTADTLFDMLVERFRMDHPENLVDEEQFNEWKDRKLLPTQRQVLTVFTAWLEDHRLLEEEPHIAQRLTDFLSLIVAPPSLAIIAKLIIQTIERLTFRPVTISPTAPTRKRRRSKGTKGELLRQDPTNIAEQLCLLEHKLYAKISPRECLTYAKVQSGPAVEHLSAFCSTHDKLAAWVKMSILTNEALGKRADTVDFWIKVAEKCRNLNNFASMSALINALSSTVITRLHLTWAHVGRKSHLDALLKYNEPTGGFSGYRSLLANAEGPCVPFIGMFLTDIVHIQDKFSEDSPSHPPNSTEPYICFLKRQRWYEVISLMLKHQSRPYNIGEGESTTSFITSHLGLASLKDQKWFWQKSQEVQQSELAHADIRKGLEAAGF